MSDNMEVLKTLQLLRQQRDKAKRDYDELCVAVRAVERVLADSAPHASEDVDRQDSNLLDCKGLTQARAAETVLKDAGRYLHKREIVSRMLRRGFEYDGTTQELEASVNTTLYKRPQFTKHKRQKATYGLTEWGPGKAEAPTGD